MITTLAVSGYRSLRDVVDGALVDVLRDGGLCEVALHQPGMLRPLRLVTGAAHHTQILVVTHSVGSATLSPRPARLRCGTSSGRSPWPRTSARPGSKGKDW